MELPTALTLHHVITHPLSRIYISRYQDKDCVSLNGFRGFMFENKLVESEEELKRLLIKDLMSDKRGCPIYMRIEKELEDEIPLLLGSTIRLAKVPTSSFPIVREEQDLIINTFDSVVDGDTFWNDDRELDITQDLVNVSNGNVISFHPTQHKFTLTSDLVLTLSLLPSLSYIYIKIYLTPQDGEEIDFTPLSNLVSLRLDIMRVDCDVSFLDESLRLFSKLKGMTLSTYTGSSLN